MALRNFAGAVVALSAIEWVGAGPSMGLEEDEIVSRMQMPAELHLEEEDDEVYRMQTNVRVTQRKNKQTEEQDLEEISRLQTSLELHEEDPDEVFIGEDDVDEVSRLQTWVRLEEQEKQVNFDDAVPLAPSMEEVVRLQFGHFEDDHASAVV